MQLFSVCLFTNGRTRMSALNTVTSFIDRNVFPTVIVIPYLLREKGKEETTEERNRRAKDEVEHHTTIPIELGLRVSASPFFLLSVFPFPCDSGCYFKYTALWVISLPSAIRNLTRYNPDGVSSPGVQINFQVASAEG